MSHKRKKTSDALTILHDRYIKGDVDRLAAIEAEREKIKIAEQVYALRKQRDLTQKQLAEIMGTTQSVISRLENTDYESERIDTLQKLAAAFNPATVQGLMCRSILSVSWDGYLFDCDFNQAIGLFMGRQKRHLSDLTPPLEPGELIALGDHCYTCTAGPGFT